MPRHCSLETFTPDDLQTISLSSSEKTSIAVLGSSIERGVFQSMVDMALRREEKLEFQTSKIGKCWGRASVQINSGFLMTFQDYRPWYINPDEKPGTVTCHNENMAMTSGYRENSTDMIKKLMYQEDPPQVVMIASGCHQRHVVEFKAATKKENKRIPDCMRHTREFVSHFPPDWNGTIYVATPSLPSHTGEVSNVVLEHYWYALRWFSNFNDKRVRILDTYEMASDMRLYSESLDKIRVSQHQHRWCNETASGMQVCSNVTEALANLMVGRAKYYWKQRQQQVAVNNLAKRELRICTDCPASLLPFHIKSKPDLTCTSGPLVHADEVGAIWNTPACPHDCLKTAPVGQAKTQSGPVDVRVCEMGNLTEGSDKTKDKDKGGAE